ncbi:GNAT family N-acetyltransferase [Micromonospora sp. STR1s_5]|nr:GNAT family N-acetyltransferase [Micromonospora sp. STR1s_5]
MTVRIVPFKRDRPRNTFECGRRPIDNWYKNKAKKCIDRAEYRVFEALDERERVVGYYALQIGNESMDALANKPDDYTKNYTAFPAVHLAFLGVQRGLQRQGIGTALLSDVFDKVYQVSEVAGLYALTLQSLDAESTAFYRSIGFEAYSPHPTAPKMLMPIRTIRELIESAEEVG